MLPTTTPPPAGTHLGAFKHLCQLPFCFALHGLREQVSAAYARAAASCCAEVPGQRMLRNSSNNSHGAPSPRGKRCSKLSRSC